MLLVYYWSGRLVDVSLTVIYKVLWHVTGKMEDRAMEGRYLTIVSVMLRDV